MTVNRVIVIFIMAPIYVSNLGHYDYGLREMLLAITGYMGMLDLGMRTAIGRFASMYNAKNDNESLLVTYTTSLTFMIMVGCFLAILLWLCAAFWSGLITPDEGDKVKYILFLVLVGAHILFLFPLFVTESYLEGLQAYYLKNTINIITSITIAIISYIYITPANGLILLTALAAVMTLLKFFIFVVILLRPTLGRIAPSFKKFSLSRLKEMLSFSIKSFVQGASFQIETSSDRLVIGSILGPSVVPVYSVPASLINMIYDFTQTLTHAFMPLFSDLNAKQEQEKIKQIYLISSKLFVGFFIPASIAIIVVGGPFIETWMRGEFSRESMDGIILLLMLYVLIPKLNPFVSRYLTAIGWHGIFAKVAPVAAIINLGLSVWLVFEIGVIGAAFGSVIPVFFVMPIYLIYSCRHLHVSIMTYIKKVVLPVMLPSVLMLSCSLWLRMTWGLNNYSEILVCASIGAGVYFVCYWYLSMGPNERYIVLKWLRKYLSW
ncbi:O-antigen/teichoic acid export membrane protein [Methylohalomonas lacus]|uniref:O-antigen/teichoic acid export membrane protein n=2 Tax=Methylohalomonas lacus TaxID=398773 RepID=A0AAE3L1N5_9GAMM|nr:O-antigen/teichoic acid export membrane protein [Methylohalomonas lacus]